MTGRLWCAQGGALATKQLTVSTARTDREPLGQQPGARRRFAAHVAAPEASATEFLFGLIDREATYAAPAHCTPCMMRRR